MIEKLNAKNRELFCIIYAVSNILDRCEEDFSHVANRVDNGEERYERVRADLDGIVHEILETIPQKQLLTIAKQMEVSEIRMQTRSAISHEDEYWAVSRADLAVLTESAIEGKCLVCNADKQKCPLREVINDLPLIIEDTDLYMVCGNIVEV